MDELVRKYRKGIFNDRDGWRCKIWFPEMEFRTLDTCVQLCGGFGWMDEMPISRMFTAARVQRIYAGATELQKSLMGRAYVKED
jgi:alkylation response protein AidB-like acyl-CoA dehydrogenase